MNFKFEKKIKKKITFKKVFFLFVIFIILFTFSPYKLSSSNSTYYANLNITLFNDGSISIINPDTNDNEFKNISHSEKFTSKNKQYWILNVTSKKIFENFIFRLTLPKNIVINYIKTTPHLRFENQNSQLKLIGIGENKPLQIVMQYKINPSEKTIQEINSNSTLLTPINVIFFTSLILLVLVIILPILFFKLKKDIKKKERENEKTEKNTNNKNETISNNKTEIDISKLPVRQQEIIKILKKKGRIPQKELENIMEIPKSSISRNLRTLEIKGIVKKEKIGITNYIFLK